MSHHKFPGRVWRQLQCSLMDIVWIVFSGLKHVTRSNGGERSLVMKSVGIWIALMVMHTTVHAKISILVTFLINREEADSLWVGGCFSARGAPQLKSIDGKLNSEKYCGILSDISIPFGESTYTGEWRFQQDNASMHTSSLTNEFFMYMVVKVLDWPVCSPDLNPINSL